LANALGQRVTGINYNQTAAKLLLLLLLCSAVLRSSAA
jgi:hypothetical protein